MSIGGRAVAGGPERPARSQHVSRMSISGAMSSPPADQVSGAADEHLQAGMSYSNRRSGRSAGVALTVMESKPASSLP